LEKKEKNSPCIIGMFGALIFSNSSPVSCNQNEKQSEQARTLESVTPCEVSLKVKVTEDYISQHPINLFFNNPN
jgi:hypothetical protein